MENRLSLWAERVSGQSGGDHGIPDPSPDIVPDQPIIASYCVSGPRHSPKYKLKPRIYVPLSETDMLINA